MERNEPSWESTNTSEGGSLDNLHADVLRTPSRIRQDSLLSERAIGVVEVEATQEVNSLTSLVSVVGAHLLNEPNPRMSESAASQYRFMIAEWIADGVRLAPHLFKESDSLEEWVSLVANAVGWNRLWVETSLRYAKSKGMILV